MESQILSEIQKTAVQIRRMQALWDRQDAMLAGLPGGGEFLQFLQAVAAPARQERQEAQIAGLQPLLRVEQIFQELLVLDDDFFVAIE